MGKRACEKGRGSIAQDYNVVGGSGSTVIAVGGYGKGAVPDTYIDKL